MASKSCSCFEKSSPPKATLKIGVLAQAYFGTDQILNSVSQELTKGSFSLTRIVCESLKFDCEFINASVDNFGQLENNGSWTGFLGLLLDGQYNTSLPYFSLTYDRHKNFSFPFVGFKEPLLFITRNPTDFKPNLKSILKPFQSETWAFLFLVICCLSALITTYEKWRKTAQSKLKYNLQVFMVLLINLARKGQKFYYLKLSTKIILAIWSISTLAIIASYTSGLLSSMLQSQEAMPFVDYKTFVKCVESGGCSYIHAPRSTFLTDIEGSTPGTPHYELKMALEKNPAIKAERYDAILDKIQQTKDRFLVSHAVGNGWLTKILKPGLAFVQYAHTLQTFAFRKNDPLREIFERQLLILESAGILTQVLDYKKTNPALKKHVRAQAIPVQSLLSLFVLLIIGSFLALIAFLFEHFAAHK